MRDLAAGLALLGETESTQGNYVFGTGDVRPLREFLQEAQRVLAPQQEVLMGQDGGDSTVLDGSRLWSMGWKPQVSFAQGMEDMRSTLQVS